MKYFAIPFILLATLLQACVNKEPSIEHDSLMEASKQELAAALEERDRLLDLVKEISSDMDQIKHLEHIMTVAGAQSFENPAQRAQLLSDMAAVKKLCKIAVKSWPSWKRGFKNPRYIPRN